MILPALLFLAQAVSPPDPAALAEALAAGDAHYARRAEGAQGATALPFQVEGAIVEYRRALSLDPSSYEARLRLLRAYFFRGGFCGEMDPDEQKKLFDEAKAVAEETVKMLDADLKRDKNRVSVDAARTRAAAGETYLWAAVSWGQWAVFHKVSAAFTGAPARIRDLAEAVISIDPATEQAGAFVLLGRLHTEAPRIPFVTMWVSRAKGIASLRRGLEIAPDTPQILFFLGAALMRLDPSKADEARALLERCAALPPRPEYLVEDVHYAQMARARLAGKP
jgi:tetratricopeptide (TPR) repeat protein